MQCPRDQEELEFHSEQGQEILGCPVCKGIYVGSQALKSRVERILEVRDGWDGITQGALPSPHTGRPMLEIEVKGVLIDLCRSSGYVWFDQGEYEKVKLGRPPETSGDTGEGGGVAADVAGEIFWQTLWCAPEMIPAFFDAVGGLVEKCAEGIDLDIL